MFSDRYRTCCFGIAILLLFFCVRIWNLGPTLHDDAAWRLSAGEGNWGVVSSWAVNQGRIFAWISGSLIYVGLYFQGSDVGSILHVGAFAIFFVAAHMLLRVYANTRVALLAAALNLALFALRWEGSIVTTYPLFSWTLGTVFVTSVYLGWRSSRENKPVLRMASYILLFISLNIHEGVTLLFGFLAVLAVVANHFCGASECRSTRECLKNRAFLRQLSGTSAVVVLYLASYVGWRLYFPSSYEGNQLGSLNPLDFSGVLLSFSFTGSVFSDLLSPYFVNYSDAISQDGMGVVYKPLRYLLSHSRNETALVSGIILLSVVFNLAFTARNSRVSSEWHLKGMRLAACILIGVAIAILPVLPVALVGKYQDHFMNLNVRSYAFTPFCHFGWAILLATAICCMERINQPILRNGLISTVAVCLGLLGYCATLKNDAIAADMRRETCRWMVMDQLSDLLPALATPVKNIHAPRLQSGSWFTVVNGDYWSRFMSIEHGRSLRFENQTISRASVAEGLAYVDYSVSRDDAQTAIFAAVLDEDDDSGQVIANEVVISVADSDPSENAQYLVSYKDLDQGYVCQRLSSLEQINGSRNVRHLQNIRAVPASIQVGREAEIRFLNVEYGDYIVPEVPARFALGSSGEQSGDLGLKWLDEHWHAAERGGVWSNAASASVTLPVPSELSSPLEINLVVSTYTGLGFADSPQQLTVQIDGRAVAGRTFKRGDGFQTISCIATPSDWASDGLIRLSLSLPAAINPAEHGYSSDSRSLGVILRNITSTNAETKIVREAKVAPVGMR